MTSKTDYQAIAKAIRESDIDIAPLDNPHGYSLDKLQLMKKLVEVFKADNQLFDEDKFREACLIPQPRFQTIPLDEKLAKYWK